MLKNQNLFIFFLIIFLSIIFTTYTEKFVNIIDINDDNSPISIIYYAYLKKERWHTIVLGQMTDLVNNNLIKYADINICLCGDKEDIEEAEIKIKEIFKSYLYKVKFSYTYENLYEYPGIKKLYDESIINPKKIFLYFHSKGMVFHENNKHRNSGEIILFRNVIDNWKQVIEIFNNNNNINKVTFGCSENGFGWFNFFWVKGKYLSKCNEPIISDNRYYYESYIGDECKDDLNECYSIISNNTSRYTNHEINNIMDKYLINI